LKDIEHLEFAFQLGKDTVKTNIKKRENKMRNMILETLKKHAEGCIEKHKTNVEVLISNPVGVADHSDHLETVSKELDAMEKYESRLEMLDKYFTKKDPFKQ